jgi:monolysocardiolipin acyltransferase
MMDDAVAVLSRPGFENWVHVFPEGRVHQVHGELLRFKWGVGRLVADPDTTPIVLPIFIEGTKRILDEKRKHRWLPSSWGGERIAIRIGEPIDFSDLVNQAKEEALTDAAVDRVKTYKRITDLIQEKVEELRVQTELPASL